jgi:hypothetical protein
MSIKHSWSPWLLAANIPAGVVVVLPILDPTRYLRPVLCLLAVALVLCAVGIWRGKRRG